ncbi:MAG: glycosyltransferase family 2 protein [Magnetococcales bacterium]|nr:glycosyltransferase family 2 protein [Magnetococcales bacterium]
MKIPISGMVLTKNSALYLRECLQALQLLDEVVVCDNGTDRDDTLAIAKSFANVTLVETPFIGFGPLRQLAARHARHDWILAVDSDEIVTPELQEELQKLILDPGCVYAVLRHNHFAGKRIRCCSWHPDYVVRLFNRRVTDYNANPVHEIVVVPPTVRVVRLQHPVKHYTSRQVSELVDKMQSYSTLFAKQHTGRRHGSAPVAVVRALASFVKDYVLKGGFLQGAEGLLISVTNANGVFYKYMKLREANRLAANPSQESP